MPPRGRMHVVSPRNGNIIRNEETTSPSVVHPVTFPQRWWMRLSLAEHVTPWRGFGNQGHHWNLEPRIWVAWRRCPYGKIYATQIVLKSDGYEIGQKQLLGVCEEANSKAISVGQMVMVNAEIGHMASTPLRSGMKNTTRSTRRRITDSLLSYTLFRPDAMHTESMRSFELQCVEVQLKLLRSESEKLSLNERIIDAQ